MSDELILFQAMCNLATKFNNKDFYEWQHRKNYNQMATEIANELKKMGYVISKPESEYKPVPVIESTHE